MSNNYYLHSPVCETCGRGDAPLHIGKSSVGWCFALHVDPDNGINDLPDWERLWSAPGARIVDECEDPVSVEDMRIIITDRHWFRTSEVNPSWYESNHAEPGPNNMARSRIEAGHCIAHGAGTWDCIVGEFS